MLLARLVYVYIWPTHSLKVCASF